MVLMGGVPQTEPGNPGLGPRRRIVSRGLTGIFANREQWRFYRDTLGMISERAGVEGKVCPLTLFGLFRVVFFTRLVFPSIPKSSGSSSICRPYLILHQLVL